MYTKYIKRFFGYSKYSSMTNCYLQTGLPTADTMLFNCKFRFSEELLSSCNKLVQVFV